MLIEYYEKTTNVDRWNKKRKIVPDENKTKKTMIKRNGRYISLQEYINENNKDCTIYDVLNTYRGDLKLTQEKLNTITHNVADELQEIDGLKDALQIMNIAKKSWEELPLEVRKEFGNNVANFQKNGLQWANMKIKAYNNEQERIKKINEENAQKAEIEHQQFMEWKKTQTTGSKE